MAMFTQKGEVKMLFISENFGVECKSGKGRIVNLRKSYRSLFFTYAIYFGSWHAHFILPQLLFCFKIAIILEAATKEKGNVEMYAPHPIMRAVHFSVPVEL
jgi:hypothetical protein